MLTNLSLFTGVGGMDIAAEWAGFKTVGQCEWADYPTKILEKHWPDVQRWLDIRTLTGESFYAKTELRTVDVISGGFPCQPFSVAGKRKGKDDDRYLWPEMLRVISEIRPTWVFGENVAGLVSMVQPREKFKVASRTAYREPDADYYERILSRQEDMQLHLIIKDLEHIGYEVQPFVIPACAVDAPHRRDRCAIVAYSNRNDSGSRRAESAEQQRKSRITNGGKVMGYTKGQRCNYWNDSQNQRATNREIDTLENTGVCSGMSLAYPDGKRWKKQHIAAKPNNAKLHSKTRQYGSTNTDWRPAQPRLGGMDDGSARWLDEPLDIPRIATGIPNRVGRLKALGNMVVPQWAYPIFNAIAQMEELMRGEMIWEKSWNT